MICNDRGVGLTELLLVLPLLTLLVAGTLLIYKIIESKNMALNDAAQINLISYRHKREIRAPLSIGLKRNNERVKVERRESNTGVFDSFFRAPLSWKSEVALSFTPKKQPLAEGKNLDPDSFSEKNLLLIDSWHKDSKFGKKLKLSIDLTHAAILLTIFGR